MKTIATSFKITNAFNLWSAISLQEFYPIDIYMWMDICTDPIVIKKAIKVFEYSFSRAWNRNYAGEV